MDHAHHAACSCSDHAPRLDRRRFVTFAGIAVGAALLPRFARAADGTDAVLLSCMDYRLTAKTTEYMASRGLAGKYDHLILAGASLGAVTLKFPDWGHTFRQHLQVAIDLHHIHQVVILDHRDCGAYKVILGKDLAGDPAAETKAHAEMLHKLRHEILEKHQRLTVDMLIMALDGSVETIS